MHLGKNLLDPIFSGIAYSKSPHIRTYFFEGQAEIGSYFKDTMSGYLGSYLKSDVCGPFQSVKNDFQPFYLCLKGPYGPIPNYGGASTFSRHLRPKLININQKSILLPLQ